MDAQSTTCPHCYSSGEARGETRKRMATAITSHSRRGARSRRRLGCANHGPMLWPTECTEQDVSHLVNESADLSWDMAIRLAKAFGGTPEGWMRLQLQYDAAQVEEWAKKIKVKMFVADTVSA
jgi:hypothetical protein